MYLPPQEIEMVKSLLNIIADPKGAQKLLDKLAQVDADLDQKKKDVSLIADEARNKLEAETKKAQDLQAEALEQTSLADERLQKASALEVSVKAESQKNEDTSIALENIKQELLAKDTNLSNREYAISVRENATSQKEVYLAGREASLEHRTQDLDTRYAKLREVVQ